MLQFIRSKASSWVIKILFFVLILSFGIWGIGDVLRSKVRVVDAATVGDHKITAEDFRREYQQQLKRVGAALGNQFTPELAKQMGMPAQVLDQMISQALYIDLARRQGLRAPDDIITSILATVPTFQNEKGVFDQDRFIAYARQLGMSGDEYIDNLRRDLVLNQIYGAIAAGANPPKQLVDALYDYRNEKRLADTILIADASIPSPPAPDEATLVAYHKDHADRYQSPEYRKLTILRLRPEALASGIKITDEQILEQYNAHKDTYATPEKRQFLLVTFADEPAARAAADEIAKGADFAAVALKASGRDPVDTGLVAQGGLLPEMSGPAFAAADGAVVGPVKTVLGWQLAKQVKAEAGKPADLASVKDKIAKQLASRQAADQMVQLANQLDDELAGGASLEDAGKKLDLAIETIADVARNGEGPDGKPIGDLIGTPQLLPVAFATDTGQVSVLTDDGAGGYFILRVDQVTPPALRPLDQVKDKVLADWQAGERDKLAIEKAKQIVGQLNLGQDMKTVAQSLGVAIKRSAPFTRDQGDPSNDVPAALAPLVFGLKKGQAVTAPDDTATNPGQIVAQLVEIEPANPATDAAGVKQMTQEIGRGLGDDLLAEFRKALESVTPVTTDPKAVDLVD
jgi:peptidyl-prolyl cis-trans isomerase D